MLGVITNRFLKTWLSIWFHSVSQTLRSVSPTTQDLRQFVSVGYQDTVHSGLESPQRYIVVSAFRPWNHHADFLLKTSERKPFDGRKIAFRRSALYASSRELRRLFLRSRRGLAASLLLASSDDRFDTLRLRLLDSCAIIPALIALSRWMNASERSRVSSPTKLTQASVISGFSSMSSSCGMYLLRRNIFVIAFFLRYGSAPLMYIESTSALGAFFSNKCWMSKHAFSPLSRSRIVIGRSSKTRSLHILRSCKSPNPFEYIIFTVSRKQFALSKYSQLCSGLCYVLWRGNSLGRLYLSDWHMLCWRQSHRGYPLVIGRGQVMRV